MRAAKTVYNPISGNFDQIDEGIADLQAYLSDLGFLRKGLEIEPNADMTVNISAGSFRGYVESKDAIQTFNFDAKPNASFIILDALTGNPLADETTLVDPTLIDDANGNQTLLSGNNRVGLVEFYQALSGQLYMLYGQIEYTSTNTAKRDYIFENKVKPSILNDAIRVGAFLLRRNASNLQNVNVVQIPINDRGQLIGSSSSEDTNVASSQIFQTQIETLSYSDSAAVESLSYTHNRTQTNSGTGVNFGDLTITRQYIGNGQAYVTIEFQTTHFQDDNNNIIITLPTGTITQPIAPNRRGFRHELNVTAYVLATLEVDQIRINRDDDINGNSFTYFRLNGIGNWVGERPDAVYLPDTTPVEEWTPYVPMLVNTDIGTGTNYAQYKVVGNTLYINGRIKFNGGSVTGLVTISLPSGFQRKSADVFCVGTATHHDPNTQWGTGSCKMETDTTFTTITADGNSSGVNPWSNIWWENSGGDLEVGYQCVIPVS